MRKEKKILCLGNVERIEAGEGLLRKAHRSAKRSARCLATVDHEALTPGEKIRYAGSLTQAGVVAYMTRKDTQKQLGVSPKQEQPKYSGLIEYLTEKASK